MKRLPAKRFQDLILANDLNYGDNLVLRQQHEEVSKLLESYLFSLLNSDS